MCSCIELKLVQILVRKFSGKVSPVFFRYLRIFSKETMSETMVTYYLRRSVTGSLDENKDLSITRVIKSKKPRQSHERITY